MNERTSLSVTDKVELARAYAKITQNRKRRNTCFKALRDETLEYLDTVEKELSEVKKGNADRVKENDDLKSEIDELKKGNADMIQEKADLEREIYELKKEKVDCRKENDDLKIENASLKGFYIPYSYGF